MTDDDDLLLSLAASPEAIYELDEPQQARLARLLADDPGAAAELAARRALLGDLARARPVPAREPSWDAMARAIAAVEVRPTLRARLAAGISAWLSPRRLAAGFALATAAAALAIFLLRGREPSPTVPPPLPLAMPRVETVEDLDDGELDTLLDGYGADLPAWVELPPFESAGADLPGGDPDGDDVLFAAPDFELWLDALDDTALDDLDRGLAEMEPV